MRSERRAIDFVSIWRSLATRDAIRTENAPPLTRQWMAMPTLVSCAAACLVLVVAVGRQAPAVSVGLRWHPGPRSPTLKLIPVDVGEMPEVVFKGVELGWPSWASWVLATLVALVILVGVLLWVRSNRRRAPVVNVARTGADSGASGEADARILQSGLVAAIEILTSNREPGNAVVQAWQGLQDAAAVAGVTRRPAETASEFTARILYRSRRSAEPIAVLLSLYQRVRFGEHSPTAHEIAAARDSLAVLVDLWQADFRERRPVRVAR